MINIPRLLYCFDQFFELQGHVPINILRSRIHVDQVYASERPAIVEKEMTMDVATVPAARAGLAAVLTSPAPVAQVVKVVKVAKREKTREKSNITISIRMDVTKTGSTVILNTAVTGRAERGQSALESRCIRWCARPRTIETRSIDPSSKSTSRRVAAHRGVDVGQSMGHDQQPRDSQSASRGRRPAGDRRS